ncbi:MAG TPA: tetratricopeptide repeat protein [Burkholderiales bacterium]|nr:tetratricopeptide repeat protein [Burkholderiales bacterium]
MTPRELIAAGPELHGPHAEAWFDRLERDEQQLEALLTGESALEIAAAVWPFWMNRARIPRGRQWLESLLRAHGERTATRAHALHGAGTLAFVQGDRAGAEPRFVESLAIAEALGDHEAVANALIGLARCSLLAGDIVQMRARSEQSLSVARRAGKRRAEAQALHHIVEARRRQGELESVIPLYEESIKLQRELGSEAGVALELHNLGNVQRKLGNLDAAEQLLQKSLAAYMRLRRIRNLGYCFLGLGNVAAARNEHERAGRLIAIADRQFQSAGTVLDPDYHLDRELSIQAVRSVLGDAYETAIREVQALSLDDAVAYAQRLR